MNPIILTLDQARTLQEQGEENWPGGYQYILDLNLPEEPDSLPDPERMALGMNMLKSGYTEEQVALQLMWKPNGSAVKSLTRLWKKEQKAL